MQSGSAWQDGAWSDSDNLLRRFDFWHFSSVGAIATAEYRKCGCGGSAITVSALLGCIGCGNRVVCNDLSWRAWPRLGTCCWPSKSASSMSDDEVDYPWSSFLASPISWTVSSSCVNNEIGDISQPQHNAWWQRIGRQTFDRQRRLAAFLNASALSMCAPWLFCE